MSWGLSQIISSVSHVPSPASTPSLTASFLLITCLHHPSCIDTAIQVLPYRSKSSRYRSAVALDKRLRVCPVQPDRCQWTCRGSSWSTWPARTATTATTARTKATTARTRATTARVSPPSGAADGRRSSVCATRSRAASSSQPPQDQPAVRLAELRGYLLLSGVPVHVVAARLGHADPAITLRVYAHVIRAAETAAADIFAQAVNAA
jgi:hypothetical protein